jgi:hypothetical protein
MIDSEKSELFQQRLSAFLACFEASFEGADLLLAKNDMFSQWLKRLTSDPKEVQRFLIALLITVPRYLTEQQCED